MFWKKKSEQMQINNPMLIALRVEDTQGTLAVHLDPDQLGNPAESGVMLADIGRHMARALAQGDGSTSEADAFATLVKIFNAEAKSPTQPVQGGLVQ